MVINSNKAIAEYLKVTSKTVMRWRDKKGLPCFKPTRGTVLTTDTALNHWIESKMNVS